MFDKYIDTSWLPGPVKACFPYCLPILITSAILGFFHIVFWGNVFGLPVLSAFTLAPGFVALVASTYHAGIRGGLISGFIVSGYAIYWAPGLLGDMRLALILGSILAIVIPVGVLVDRSRKVDTADMILSRLSDLDTYVLGLTIKWAGGKGFGQDKGMPVHPGYEEIRHVHHTLANILTLAAGWHELANEREEVLNEALSDLNNSND